LLKVACSAHAVKVPVFLAVNFISPRNRQLPLCAPDPNGKSLPRA